MKIMAAVNKYRNKWKCQVRIKGYPPRTQSFDTRSKAVAWGTQVEAEMRRGVFVMPDRMTQDMIVAQLLDRYVREESVHKASGLDDVRRAKPLKAILGGYGVANLTPVHLRKYKLARCRVRAPQTVVHELNLLHRAYVVAVQELGLVLPSGIPSTSRPKLPPGRQRRVSEYEAHAIVNDTKSIELKVIVPLAIETAMRRSEILGIRLEHVRLDRRTVLLPKTKNGESRTIPLSTRAHALLASWIAQLPESCSEPIFKITPRCLTQAFLRACRRLKILGLRFHDLRHEATSRLFERGLNVIEVSRITGHKSLAMLNRYTHLDAGNLAEKLG
jgi:integrase